MTAIVALQFTNLLFAGVLAGCEIGIHYGVGSPPLIIGDTASLQVRQAAGRRLRILIPGLFLPTAITAVMITIREGAAPYARLRWMALLCLAVWIGTRAFVTVPVNSAVLDWPASSPPAGWKDRIALAQRVHIIGVWATLLAFVCLLAAALSRRLAVL